VEPRPARTLSALTPAHRTALLSSATRWCSVSVVWAVATGGCALAAGLASSSVALVGFGANSMLDGTASAILVWRFRHERRGVDGAGDRRVSLAVGALMAGVALYVGASAIGALADRSAPERSLVGIILTAASLLVLPVLARAKLGLAAQLNNTALRGDGVLSLAGSSLAAATLVSLVLEAAPSWWWTDAIASLFISAVLLGEGARTSAAARRSPRSSP
jgi:divalent metal cation (Fe/Co/Zn/Cd) transporter